MKDDNIDLARALEACVRVRKVLDAIPDLQFSYTFDDTEAKETAVRVGAYEGLRSQRANRPRGSAYAVLEEDEKLFLLSYHWGHTNPTDNGYAGMIISLKAFKARPDGFALFSEFMTAFSDAFQFRFDLASIRASLHQVWSN